MQFRTPKFEVEIWKEDEYYVAQCKDPDVASQGKTIREALINVSEAISIVLEDRNIEIQPQKTQIQEPSECWVRVIIDPIGKPDVYPTT